MTSRFKSAYDAQQGFAPESVFRAGTRAAFDGARRFAGGDVAASRARLAALARLLDTAFAIPGTNIRMGADAALNVVPGIGLLLAKGMSAYLIFEARRLGVPRATLLRMIGNLGIDAAISVVPLAGWVGDIFFRANKRNMALLDAHLDGMERARA